MSDVMVSKTGQSSGNHLLSTDTGQDLFRQLQISFPEEKVEDYTAVSESYTHEVFGSECVRTCVSTEVCLSMLGVTTASAHRIFMLDTGESFFLANKVFTDSQPSWIPEGALAVSVMDPYAEYKNPPPDGFDSFKEYFVAMRPAVAIAEFGVAAINTGHDVIYSILADDNDTILATRSYLNYLEGYGSVSSLRQVAQYLYTKIGRADLAEAFISGDYVD